MTRLVVEIGFGELLFGVIGAGLVGVLLMLLYHRLAIRRERELHIKREEALELRARALDSARNSSGGVREQSAQESSDLDFYR